LARCASSRHCRPCACPKWKRNGAAASLRQAADANVLADRWEALPKPLRNDPASVAAYAERAAAMRWEEAAARSARTGAGSRWDESLADLTAACRLAGWNRAAPMPSAGCLRIRAAPRCW
jgi:uncharacterized protein HemY